MRLPDPPGPSNLTLMAYYSALLANTQNGPALLNTGLLALGANNAVAVSGGQQTYTRVSPVTNPHVVIADPGGFISADFVVPSEIAAGVAASLRFGAWCWIYDGRTPIFYGKIDAQPRPDTNGDVLVSVTGFWGLLSTTRFREAWDDPDLSKWVPTHLNDHSPSIELTSRDHLKVSWPSGTVLSNGNRAQVDNYLFNEPVGARDTKKIFGFDIHASDDDALNSAAINFRVYGRQAPDSGAEDQLVNRATAGGTFTNSEGATADSWPTFGYRLLRLGMQAVAGATLGQDRSLHFDRIRIGTREALLTTFGSPPSSSSLAADVFALRSSDTDWGDLPMEFWRSPTSSPTSLATYGSDPVTRGVPDSGVGVDSMTFSDWVSPAEALDAITAIDGFQVGFYYPANAQSGWWPANVLPWPQQMPQMTYEPWADLATPDYRVRIGKGASVELDDSPQPLVSTLYVNYEKHSGRQFSMVVNDDTSANYLFANGMQRAEDYQIDTPVSDNVATSLAQQVFTLRRQPLAAGQVTVWANRPGSITTSGGASLARLSQLRPGVVHIPDLPRSSYKTGHATSIEWWGETLDEAEHATLTLEHPGTVSLPRRLGAVAALAQRTIRVRGGLRKRR